MRILVAESVCRSWEVVGREVSSEGRADSTREDTIREGTTREDLTREATLTIMEETIHSTRVDTTDSLRATLLLSLKI